VPGPRYFKTPPQHLIPTKDTTMSFQTGLSGLNAASRNLDVIGNNIANANTTGMKQSRTEFSSIVASTLGAAANGSGGIGVGVAAVSQQFTQGSISITGNNLDVAINGGGFIQLKQPDGSSAYTRDGALKVDKGGFLKTNSGANVMGFPTDPTTGKAAGALLQPLVIPTAGPIAAKATTFATIELNLDARATPARGVDPVVGVAASGTGATAVAAVVAKPGIPSTPRSTYGTSVNVYDAQGVASPVSLYFEKQPLPALNTWRAFTSLSATALPLVPDITFNDKGVLIALPPPTPQTTPPTPSLTIATGPNAGKFGFRLGSEIPAPTTQTGIVSNNPNDLNGIMDGPLDIVLNGSTQFGSAFAVSNLSQDGYTSGEMIGLNIGENGTIATLYSNGQTQYSGQIALADFRNTQGLSPLGGNAWAATFESGAPVTGAPGSGKFGGLRAGALEDSNVDLTAELVNMMTAQRAYQANAQTIKTQDQVMSTLVNLR
jgi:flagellar hook protein FlgE